MYGDRMSSLTYRLAGQLTRMRGEMRVRGQNIGGQRVVKEVVVGMELAVEGPTGHAAFAVNVPVRLLPMGVDVDDVQAEVFVVLTWGAPELGEGDPAIEAEARPADGS